MPLDGFGGFLFYDGMFSDQYDDVYFSRDGGMEETRHVFLDGCGLTAKGFGYAHNVIAETGFGTGLNALMAWKLFEEQYRPGQTLDFISFEKHPLTAQDIETALQGWAGALSPYLGRLCARLPLRVNGVHPIRLSPHFRLILVYGDLNDTMPRLDSQVDYWFLDGFTPAKNPDMWGDTLFNNMARMSHQDTCYATFTAAGRVKNGLKQVGFTIEKRKGFGKKRDMLCGRFTQNRQRQSQTHPEKVAIIGAGLAGLTLSRALSTLNIDHMVYHSDPIGGAASGNRLGMINPKLTAKPTPHSDYYSSAFSFALQTYQTLQKEQDIGFMPHGSLHLQISEDKQRRFNGYINHLGWHTDHIHMLDADEAGRRAGVKLNSPALFYPDAAVASPRKIGTALAKQTQQRKLSKILYNNGLWQIFEGESVIDEASHIIIAAGTGTQAFCPDLAHALSATRGQVSHVTLPVPPKTNICFGGYVTPALADGVSMLGATFQPWDDDPTVRQDDHHSNIQNWVEVSHQAEQDIHINNGWTGFRTSSKDRFPVIGRLNGLMINTAHGSHGLTSAPYAAEILLSHLSGQTIPCFREVGKALSPDRFIQNLSTE